jgi:hypothetical protein
MVAFGGDGQAVADGGGAEVASGEVLVVDVLGLERGEEALGDGVVVAVPGAK